MEHGTLEDRGEARARGCKSGREGWSLATVYVESDDSSNSSWASSSYVTFSPFMEHGTFKAGSCTASLLREGVGVG